MKTLFLGLLIACSGMCRAQTFKMPVLGPYELGGKVTVQFPDSVPEWYTKRSAAMELTDLPKKYPYRTVAHYRYGLLNTLHVVFGETGDGLTVEGYEEIKNILLKLWGDYPNGKANGRRGLENLVHVWETQEFRMEWTLKPQPGSTIHKMGWLFVYMRDTHVESY